MGLFPNFYYKDLKKYLKMTNLAKIKVASAVLCIQYRYSSNRILATLKVINWRKYALRYVTALNRYIPNDLG